MQPNGLKKEAYRWGLGSALSAKTDETCLVVITQGQRGRGRWSVTKSFLAFIVVILPKTFNRPPAPTLELTETHHEIIEPFSAAVSSGQERSGSWVIIKETYKDGLDCNIHSILKPGDGLAPCSSAIGRASLKWLMERADCLALHMGESSSEPAAGAVVVRDATLVCSHDTAGRRNMQRMLGIIPHNGVRSLREWEAVPRPSTPTLFVSPNILTDY
ncbi:hypothetical protein EYF80_022158 [Liparis tanakae]|uniref:Uncharacterized protein n=1 Tax=Liparis tanakae TaxID=230148 RepID=A0A4Z2HP17_9TELE|nr:hypothetical protein EYF80_022158 [Liparis tanakae]